MWILAWTTNHGNNDLRDFWIICETEDEARQEGNRLLEDPLLHCWAIAPIAHASEPHWVEGDA